MADVVNFPVPSSPIPPWAPIVQGLIRHALTAAAGAGFIASAYNTDSTAAMLSGMAISIGTAVAGVAWSWWQKHQAASAAHAGAVASANAATPLQVTPAGAQP